MPRAKYSIYSGLQPNQRQGDEVYDKWKKNQQIDRDLDIKEDRLKEDKKTAKDKKIVKYKEEEWNNPVENWTEMATEITRQSAVLYREIQESNMTESEKAGKMAVVDTNPDALNLMYKEHEDLFLKIEADENLNDIKKTELYDRIKVILKGSFLPVFDKETYEMSYIDKSTKKPFSVEEARESLRGVRASYGEEVSLNRMGKRLDERIKAFDNPQLWHKFNKNTGYWEMKTDKVMDQSLYNPLYREEYFSGDVPKEGESPQVLPDRAKLSKTNRMTQDRMNAQAALDLRNNEIDNESVDKPKSIFSGDEAEVTSWTYEDGTVKASTVLSAGRVTKKTVSVPNSVGGESVTGIPLSITIDKRGELSSISIMTDIPDDLTEKFRTNTLGNMLAKDFMKIGQSTSEVIDLTKLSQSDREDIEGQFKHLLIMMRGMQTTKQKKDGKEVVEKAKKGSKEEAQEGVEGIK